MAAVPPFFPMSRGDRLYLVLVLVGAVVALLPWSRDIEVGGMSLMGWLLAGLMVLAPVVAIVRIVREPPQEDAS